MKNFIYIISTSFLLLVFSAIPALAHVVVKPNQIGVAAYQTFTVGVPNEKEQPVTALRLEIPEGVEHVSPNVKPGWIISLKKTGSGEDAKVTEISWTGGTIPVGQREDFLFSAQAPASEQALLWKAYQTYADGTVVSWDQNPDELSKLSDEEKEKQEQAGKGPYSQTEVINDLTAQPTPAPVIQDSKKANFALVLSIVAIAFSGTSMVLQRKKKK